MYIKRFIASWCMTAFIMLSAVRGEFILKTYAGKISVVSATVITAALFLLLTCAEYAASHRLLNGLIAPAAGRIDDWALALSFWLYALAVTYKYGDLYFYIGVMCAITVAAVYLFWPDRLGISKIKLSPLGAAVTAAVIAGLCSALIALLTVLRYLTYSAPNFDFGIFANMFYNMNKNLEPLTTCERDGLLSHFAVHISPIYYLILPFYHLFPFPETLQIAQSVIIFSAVIPLFLISRIRKLSPKLTAAVCVAFCFYPALSGGCFYDIHENCFLTPLLLWMFYFIERQSFAENENLDEKRKKRRRFINYTGIYTSAALVLFVKEDAAVYVAFAALFIIVDRREFKHGFILFAMSVAYFLWAVYYLNSFGEGIMESRYSNFLSSGDGLIYVVLNLFRNPALLFSEAFNSEKLEFILQMLVPAAFLPLVTRRIPRLTLLLPMVLINLMPGYKYQHSIFYQYTFGVTAFIFFAAVLNLSEMTAAAKRTFAAIAASASILLFNSAILDKLYYIEKYKTTRYETNIINQCLNKIPSDAAVQASTFFVARLAQRDEIYETETVHPTEYLVYDMRYEEETNPDFLIQLYRSDGFEVADYYQDIILVMKKAPAQQDGD